jgi:hypothetical protein
MKSEDERRGTVRKMKVAIAVIVSAAGLVTIYSGMIGTYNVARWIQHVANYNFYIDPRWDWVAETLLYAAAFMTCGGVSMATVIRRLRGR